MAKRPEALAREAVEARLSDLDGWILENGRLHRSFRFGDFAEAFAFMTRVAIVAEKMDHHPEWANVYDRLTVDLTTHDAGGVTDLDFELARAMDGFARAMDGSARR